MKTTKELIAALTAELKTAKNLLKQVNEDVASAEETGNLDLFYDRMVANSTDIHFFLTKKK